MQFFIAFITGLTTGGLSCLAVQGGLLASVIANQKEQELSKHPAQAKGFDQFDWLPVCMFLVAKLVAHTVLGFLLGWLGATLTLSLEVRLFFQAFTALFMVATAMNLLNVHPLFRYLAFQPPRFLQRLVRNTSKSQALFAPAVLGALTIFVPCGVTQAMEVLAINSGHPLVGAGLLFSFVLGTSPIFAALGVATSRLSEAWYSKFAKVAALLLLAMAIYSLNGVLVVINSPLTLGKLASPLTYFFSSQRFEKVTAGTSGETTTSPEGVQEVTIRVTNNGYQPNKITVKKDVPVRLTLVSKDTYSCALAFVFKEYGIKTFLEANDSESFTFTPTKTGTFTFSCSMGMYSGQVIVK